MCRGEPLLEGGNPSPGEPKIGAACSSPADGMVESEAPEMGPATLSQERMTEAEVIKIIREYLERLFPKDCPRCQRRFASLREYLLTTKQLGPAISYDLDLGNWNPLRPMGTLSLSNCACGTTLALSSSSMPLSQLGALLNWGSAEARKRGQTPQELLNYFRDEIWKQVLAAPDKGTP